MSPRGTDRADRLALALLGLVLLAGGGALLAQTAGAFGPADGTVLTTRVSDALTSSAPWSAVGLAVVAVLLGLLGLRWAVAQLRGEGTAELELERDRSAGSTVLTSGAVADAVERDCEAVHGVAQAHARLRPRRGGPVLVVRLRLEDRADLAAVREQVEQGVVARTRAALERDDLPVQLELRLAEGRTAAFL